MAETIKVDTYLCSLGVQPYTCIGRAFEVNFFKWPPPTKELKEKLPQNVVIQVCRVLSNQRQDVFKCGQCISIHCVEHNFSLDDTVIYSCEQSFDESISSNCSTENSALIDDNDRNEDSHIHVLYSDSTLPCGESWQDITDEVHLGMNRNSLIYKYRAQRTGVYCVVQVAEYLPLSRILQTMNQISSNIIDKYVTVTITRKPGTEKKAIIDCSHLTDPSIKQSLYKDSFNQLLIAMGTTCDKCLYATTQAGSEQCVFINPKLDAGDDNRQPLSLGEHATEDTLVWIYIYRDDSTQKSTAKLLLEKRPIWNYQHTKMPLLRYKYQGKRVRAQSSAEFNAHAAKRHLRNQVQDSLQPEQSFSLDSRSHVGSLSYATFEEFNRKRVNQASKDRLNIFLKLIDKLHIKKKK